MIKNWYVFIFLLVVLLFSGCTNYKQANSDLQVHVLSLENDNAILTTTISDFQKENEYLKGQITILQAELDDLKYGAQNLLIQIRNAYESEKYQEVITLSIKLHEKFNGTPEDIEGQKIALDSQKILDEIERLKQEEEEKRLAEAIKSEQEKARSIIRVSRVYPGKPNSAGGVDLYVNYTNNSNKIIKYIAFSVVPYNAVDDVVSCEIRRYSTFRGRSTGPIKPGESRGSYNYWENAWYNNTIKTVVLQQVDIEYMDGTRVTLKGDIVKHIQY